MCKLGLLTYVEYIVPWLLMPWRLTAPGHQQPWYSIFVLVFGHFRFSEFRLYWWIRVLDSVKCPSFLTNYKAFSATKAPWVELCLGSVGEKDGHKILNIGAGTREMVSAGPDKTLEPFVSAFLCLALAWEALFDVLLWGRAWQRLPLKSRRAAGVVDFMNTWSRSRLVCGRPGGRPLRWWSIFYVFGLYGVYLWKVRPRSGTYCGLARALQVGFMTLNLAPLDIWSGTWVAGLSVWVL